MINLFEPHIGSQSLALLNQVFESKWLGRGSVVTDFERQWASFMRIDGAHLHTIGCCTDALFSAFEILGIPAGSEVIVPSISFPAVGSAAKSAGMVQKIVDIDADSGNVSLDAVERALTPKTAAVFITHYGGIPVDVVRLRALVGPKVKIIEDAACALGTFIDGVACGTFGDFGCWSFDAMKLLTCGEGGGLYVADSQQMVHAKEHFYLGLPAQAKSGIDRQATDARWWEYQLNTPGRRSIFTNVNAAIGLPQFATLGDALKRRQDIRQQYTQTLDALGVNYLRQTKQSVVYSNYFFTVISPRRDELAGFLKSRGIYSTFRYYPLHRIDLFRADAQDCTNATNFSETALNIPIHQALSDDDVAKICEALRTYFTQ